MRYRGRAEWHHILEEEARAMKKMPKKMTMKRTPSVREEAAEGEAMRMAPPFKKKKVDGGAVQTGGTGPGYSTMGGY